eukprot:TRINITY_DN18349_c0_g1_i5.p1 TRINITY_DN18349_c0_g1~~TRINITY_DN18349_c0_g1_i5.p1  ORF type:complete len:269 (-),score=30.66 TRINITY_DN18349_c0_g1_i5:36-842(-)
MKIERCIRCCRKLRKFPCKALWCLLVALGLAGVVHLAFVSYKLVLEEDENSIAVANTSNAPLPLPRTAQDQHRVTSTTTGRSTCEDDAEHLNFLVFNATQLALRRHRQSAHRIIFVKTHKTASTTVGSIVARWASRHHRKVLVPFGDRIIDLKLETANEMKQQSADVMYHHISGFQGLKHLPGQGEPWSTTEHLLRMVIPYAKMGTSLRKPIPHAISWYCYMYVRLSFVPSLQLARVSLWTDRQRRLARGEPTAALDAALACPARSSI